MKQKNLNLQKISRKFFKQLLQKKTIFNNFTKKNAKIFLLFKKNSYNKNCQFKKLYQNKISSKTLYRK